MAMRFASAVDSVCISIIIDDVTVTVSITVAVSVVITVANHHFFQEQFS
jgi:hypothetical protein